MADRKGSTHDVDRVDVRVVDVEDIPRSERHVAHDDEVRRLVVPPDLDPLEHVPDPGQRIDALGLGLAFSLGLRLRLRLCPDRHVARASGVPFGLCPDRYVACIADVGLGPSSGVRLRPGLGASLRFGLGLALLRRDPPGDRERQKERQGEMGCPRAHGRTLLQGR